MTLAGRPPELPLADATVGLFINTVPMRVEVRPEASVASLLDELHAQQARLQAHELGAAAAIQGWSEVDARHALFESAIVFESYPRRCVGGRVGLGCSRSRASTATSRPTIR